MAELFLPISFKPSYKTLFKNDVMEVRKYPPCKKTINVFDDYDYHNLKSYFVPLPHQVYITIYRKFQKQYRRDRRIFFVSFAAEDDEFVYPTPFYSVEEAICLDLEWHLYIPDEVDLNEAVSRFWSTSFNLPIRLNEMLGISSLKGWSELTTSEVVNRLHYGRRSTSSLIEKLIQYFG